MHNPDKKKKSMDQLFLHEEYNINEFQKPWMVQMLCYAQKALLMDGRTDKPKPI